jgi:hypothetical protein
LCAPCKVSAQYAMPNGTSMNIRSQGDRIRPGTYAVRARFARSVVLLDPTEWPLFIVDRSIGPGPLNLVVDKPDAFLPTEHYHLASPPARRLFCSAMPSMPPGSRRRLVRLLLRLPDVAPPHSLATLLAPEPTPSPFRQARDQIFRRAMEAASDGNPDEAVRLVRGCGEGLTPSGDDFLCGWMLACRLRKRPALARRMLPVALGGNPISNAFLRLAAEGRVNRPLRTLLLSPSPSSLRNACRFGHSSGADLLCGLLYGLHPAAFAPPRANPG